jgi:hypothetical protein
MSVDRRAPLLLLSLFWLSAEAAHTEPLDLGNSRPRWIHVEFEVSPQDRPDQLDAVYTRPLPAWLEPADAEGRLVARVASRIVERHLFGDENPVAGSFSDFVWRFDAATGHVESAVVSGSIRPTFGWGFLSKSITADIRIEMTTRGVAGFTAPKRRLGQLIFEYCAEPHSSRCTLVEAVRYEPRSGYVNAVGDVTAKSSGLRTRSFSPLGEARFSEATGFALQTASQALAEPPIR